MDEKDLEIARLKAAVEYLKEMAEILVKYASRPRPQAMLDELHQALVKAGNAAANLPGPKMEEEAAKAMVRNIFRPYFDDMK